MKNAWMIVLLVWIAAGCDDSLFSSRGPTLPGSAISERRFWQASGDLQDCRNAIDGSLSTYAIGASENATITLDMGKPCVFNLVVIDHGNDENGYCRRMALLTSMDGENFSKICEGPDVRRIAYLCPVTPQLARYVRVQVIQAGAKPWSVAEIGVR